jgi:hypothetical protein
LQYSPCSPVSDILKAEVGQQVVQKVDALQKRNLARELEGLVLLRRVVNQHDVTVRLILQRHVELLEAGLPQSNRPLDCFLALPLKQLEAVELAIAFLNRVDGLQHCEHVALLLGLLQLEVLIQPEGQALVHQDPCLIERDRELLFGGKSLQLDFACDVALLLLESQGEAGLVPFADQFSSLDFDPYREAQLSPGLV